MAVNDLYQVNTQCEVANQQWSWGFQYQMVSGLPGPDMLEELAINFGLLFQLAFNSMSANDCRWAYTEALPISLNDEIPGSAPTLLGGGSFGGLSIPLNMAAKVTWITNAPNSKFNGSTSFSGVSADAQDAGILDGPMLTAFDLLCVALNNNILGIGVGAAEFQPVVVSRFVNGGKRPAPVPFAILGFTISSRLGNMRRRTTNARRQV